MTEGCGYSFTESVIERNHTAVGQRQLQFTHTLLSCNFSGYRAVHFIGKPIFASHSFEMKHRLEIVKQLGAVIRSILVMSFHSFVLHYSLWRMTKHLCNIKVKGLHAIALHERKMCIPCGFAHNVQRSALTLCNFSHMLYVLFVNKKSHAFLAFVCNYFL